MKKALSIVRSVYTNSENAIGGKARSRFRRECNAVLLIQIYTWTNTLWNMLA